MKMRTLGLWVSILFCTISLSCGTSIKSVVDHSSFAHPYHAPLAVLPCQSGPLLRLSNKLGDVFAKVLATDSIKLNLLIFERHEQELTLNNHDDVDQKITDSVQANENDLVLLFKPTQLELSNGSFTGIKYIVTAIDVSTHKDVWKAEFQWKGGTLAGNGAIAESISKALHEKLVADGVL